MEQLWTWVGDYVIIPILAPIIVHLVIHQTSDRATSERTKK
ncbi:MULTISPECIES: hypothetical protein [unclassified Exiguobacterium]|nr:MULTISPECIES: hypothetical protein [unclassified Exiguobacterium]